MIHDHSLHLHLCCAVLCLLYGCCLYVLFSMQLNRHSLTSIHSNNIRTLGQYNEEKHKETTWFQFYLAALVALCFAHAWMTWSFGQWQLPVEKELSESIDKIVNTWLQYHLLCSFITICFICCCFRRISKTLQYDWVSRNSPTQIHIQKLPGWSCQ